MKIINTYEVSPVFIQALQKDIQKPKPDIIRTTELINPPIIRRLTLQHWDEIEVDVAHRIFPLLGTAVHSILQTCADKNALAEEELVTEIDGQKISGKPDLFYDGIIEDYKTTKVYTIQAGAKTKWIEQLNVYAYLYRRAGFVVNELYVNVIMVDWRLRDLARSKPNNEYYPPAALQRLKIPLWDAEQQEAFVKACIARHRDITQELCTPEERWSRVKWSVAVEDNVLRVCNSLKKAQLYSCIPDAAIQPVEEEPKRCLYYCDVKTFCPFYQDWVRKQKLDVKETLL